MELPESVTPWAPSQGQRGKPPGRSARPRPTALPSATAVTPCRGSAGMQLAGAWASYYASGESA